MMYFCCIIYHAWPPLGRRSPRLDVSWYIIISDKFLPHSQLTVFLASRSFMMHSPGAESTLCLRPWNGESLWLTAAEQDVKGILMGKMCGERKKKIRLLDCQCQRWGSGAKRQPSNRFNVAQSCGLERTKWRRCSFKDSGQERQQCFCVQTVWLVWFSELSLISTYVLRQIDNYRF